MILIEESLNFTSDCFLENFATNSSALDTVSEVFESLKTYVVGIIDN